MDENKIFPVYLLKLDQFVERCNLGQLLIMPKHQLPRGILSIDKTDDPKVLRIIVSTDPNYKASVITILDMWRKHRNTLEITAE